MITKKLDKKIELKIPQKQIQNNKQQQTHILMIKSLHKNVAVRRTFQSRDKDKNRTTKSSMGDREESKKIDIQSSNQNHEQSHIQQKGHHHQDQIIQPKQFNSLQSSANQCYDRIKKLHKNFISQTFYSTSKTNQKQKGQCLILKRSPVKTNNNFISLDQTTKTNNKDASRYTETYKQISRKGKWLKIIAKYKNYSETYNEDITKFMCIEQIKAPNNKAISQQPNNKLNRKFKNKQELSHLTKFINRSLYDEGLSEQQSKKQSDSLFKQTFEYSGKKHCKNHGKNNCSSVLISSNNYQLLQASSRKQMSFNMKTVKTNNRRSLLKMKKTSQQNCDEFLLRKPILKKDYFVFGLNDRITQQNKLEYFRDFLWKINFSNGIHVDTPKQIFNPYQIYIGPGNNSGVIRNIIKKRFWWVIIEKGNNEEKKDHLKNYNFIWTQLKVNQFFQFQNMQQQINYPSNTNIDPTNLQKQKCSEDFNVQSQMLYNHSKIFGENDLSLWSQYISRNLKAQEKITEKTYIKRLPMMKQKNIRLIKKSEELKVHNHLSTNFYIGNKKSLFYNMRRYLSLKKIDPFSMMPLTFHVSRGVQDPQFIAFKEVYQQFQGKCVSVDWNEQNPLATKKIRNIWIMKPGENSNRGTGISVCYSINDVLLRLRSKERNSDGKLRTFILQKYIENPLLYNRRKFDIRHYVLISCINGQFKAYWYQEGYLRTASAQFSLKYSKDPLMHLTNDAIQKNGENYGKYEKGNKLSYIDFQKYLEMTFKDQSINFFNNILPQMKNIATQAVKSCYSLLDENRRCHNFQLLGLDYMIDENFKPWLIQINTNPCLEQSCSLLERLIPQLINNTFKLTIDPLFPPPEHWQASKKLFFGDNPLGQNKFSIIFDQQSQGLEIQQLYKGVSKLDDKMGAIEEDDEFFVDFEEIDPKYTTIQ